MSMLKLQHYTIRFRESQRLRYRLPRLVWRFLVKLGAREHQNRANRERAEHISGD